MVRAVPCGGADHRRGGGEAPVAGPPSPLVVARTGRMLRAGCATAAYRDRTAILPEVTAKGGSADDRCARTGNRFLRPGGRPRPAAPVLARGRVRSRRLAEE